MNENVVLARVYQGNNLVGVFPRTQTGADTLEIILTLINFENEITIPDQQVFLQYTAQESPVVSWLQKMTGDLRVATVSAKEKDLFSQIQQEKVSEETIQVAQNLLEQGIVRTAEKIYNPSTGEARWQTQLHGVDCMNALFKRNNTVMGDGYYDKVPLLTQGWKTSDFEAHKVRFIPSCFARAGCYIGPGTTLMPGSIVNTGAYIAGGGAMIDGGARVATGAQIGKGVKLGAGSGVEGILEPKGMLPTIIEDNVRVGAQCELSGIIEEGAAIATGVQMSKQKKIFDARTGKFQEPRVMQVGDKPLAIPYIPKNRLALPGFYLKEKSGFIQYGIACTILHEKDASEMDFMEFPKNADLYVRI